LVIVVASAIFSTESFGQNDSAKHILIYYGNETTKRAAASKNYSVLLTALRAYRGGEGRAIADAINADATMSPAVVQGESQVLLQSCGRLNTDIAIFTNELTLGRRFLMCRGAAHTVDFLPFGDLDLAPDNILDLTPLSRPEYLQAMLEHVAALFPDVAIKAVLITHSHGGIGMALMPRVSADVANIDSGVLGRILEFRTSEPSWAALKGTTKAEYWRALAEVSRKYRMRFALVFRQACESGLDSWTEFRMIPESVKLIAHTAMSDLPYGKIDYESLLSAAEAAPDFAGALASNLRGQGMHVDDRETFLFWLGPVYLWSLPSMIWFSPLALWICWFGWTRGARFW
jgi:hypothetical protein